MLCVHFLIVKAIYIFQNTAFLKMPKLLFYLQIHIFTQHLRAPYVDIHGQSIGTLDQQWTSVNIAATLTRTVEPFMLMHGLVLSKTKTADITLKEYMAHHVFMSRKVIKSFEILLLVYVNIVNIVVRAKLNIYLQ